MTKKEYKGSIKTRLTLIILLVTLLTGIFGYSSFVYWNLKSQYDNAVNLSKTVGNILGQDIAKLILLKDISSAADITSKLKHFHNLDSMVLYKLSKEPIFQYSKNNKHREIKPLEKDNKRKMTINKNLLSLFVDAIYEDNHLGYVQLNFQVVTIWDIIRRDFFMLISSSIILLLFSFSLANFFAKKFTKPILKLVSFLNTIELFDSLKHRIYTKEDNEFGKLYDEVNYMLQRVEKAQETEKIAAAAFEITSGMMITDENKNILQVNKAFTKITGYKKEEAIGKSPALLKSSYQDKFFYEKMHNTLNKFHYWSGEIYNKRKNGTIFPEHLTIQAVLDDNSKLIYYVASFIDLTVQKESEAKIKYLQQYDSLTGLANKDLLISKIQKHIDEKKQEDWGILLCLDFKDFKIINEAYGHNVGDLILQIITKKLKESFEDSDLISRIGADEFVIWFSSIEKSKSAASIEAKILAEFLVSKLSESIVFEDKVINNIPYVGIALYDEDLLNANELFKQADTALHLAKKNEQSFAFFDRQANNIAQAHLDTYSQLHKAIEYKEFELYYQLQYTEDNKIFGAEALIRWNHPTRGRISPDDFIPIAEKTTLILPITSWVINTACIQLKQWQKNDYTKDWVLAINISAKQFLEENFVKEMQNYLNIYKIKKNSLKLELTESLLVKDLDTTRDKMKALKDLGIQISLDDFGTGYSSLQYLKKLPLDQVKIDKSFIKNILEDKSDIAIIKSVILLAEALDLQVIAEGVETKEHYEFLKDLGCKLFQGFYFAKPQRIKDIVANNYKLLNK
ncbi:diguanylate cyclase [Halarcobacter mediterraneus]|uniref:Diguanylate cyclase n=1 Tax=Halarcobacter mediterraneus TaxID=2023153 RepID=A0A4Q1ASR8_9BACT|nr:GGDEF domain-containing phosphodiesterase [Halarcobacter mediterraneus]RXK12733.1 diguanylate cyclase [Halarcobacter mediterraneus]